MVSDKLYTLQKVQRQEFGECEYALTDYAQIGRDT